MTTLIIGPGAIGRLLACRLAAGGQRVRLLGRRPLPTIQTLTSPDGTTQRLELATTTEPRLACVDVDQVMLTTKAYAASAAFAAVADHLLATTPLVLWQNGLRVQRPLTDTWSGPVLCASTTEGAFIEADDSVVHAGQGQTLIGHLDGGLDRPLGGGNDTDTQALRTHALQTQALARSLATTLSAAGLATEAVDDIATRLWHKLAVNAAINPLVARYRLRNGELRAHPYRDMVDATVDEVAKILAALGIPAPAIDVPSSNVAASDVNDGTRAWHALVWQVIERTAANRASMLQDIEAGRPTEHDAILGPLREAAARLGLPCPLLDAHWRFLNA
ncbi:ketopantoate reductase family protein [Halomonas litopenaei]|uniref:ketopantoate reductase family protein n=1 Tax=Halomonas litopenaei TaxID=2109328 RepID=UPI003FA16DC1